MTYQMSPGAFVAKCEWEGGIEEAILGYGLTEDDLDDSDPEFKEAVRQFRAVAGPLAEKLHEFTVKYEGWDPYAD